MERLMNSDSTVKQLWNPITLWNAEDVGDIFFETSALTKSYTAQCPNSIKESVVEVRQRRASFGM
jgi:hypothetical protein